MPRNGFIAFCFERRTVDYVEAIIQSLKLDSRVEK